MTCVVAILLAPVCSLLISQINAKPIAFVDFLRAHLLSLPAKYIPGGVWQLIGRGYYLRENGVSIQLVSRIFFLEHVFAFTTSFTIGLSGLLLSKYTQISLIALVFIWLGLPVLYTMFRRLITGGGHTQISHSIVRRITHAYAVYAVAWLCMSVSFTAFISAFLSFQSFSDYVYLLFVYLFSWSIGFIFILAPQGVGVFEYIVGKIGIPGYEMEVLIPIVFTFRLLVMMVDMMLWSAYSMLSQKKEGTDATERSL